MALQIRRGTNAVRIATLLLAGEPFYVTDNETANVGPFWLGDGVTLGGNPVTSGPNPVLNQLSDVYVVSPANNQHLVWDTATNRWVNRSNITVPGTLSAGNIDITGPITTRDNYFTLNNDNTTLTGANNGFTLKRGTGKADVWIRYDATLGAWQFTNDGTTYWPFPDQTSGTTSDVTFKSLTTTEGIKSGTGVFTLNNQNAALTDFNNGIFLKRGGANPDAVIKYNASTTRWQISDDGVNYFNLTVTPQSDLHVNRLGIGTFPSSQQLQLFNSDISNMSLTTSTGSAILTNNSVDNLLSLNYYGANRLQFNGSSGHQWFNSGRTGFNTTNPTETVDVNGTIKGTNLLIAAGVTSASVFTSAIATNSLSASGNATVSGDLTVTSGNLVINSGNITSPAVQGNLFNAGVNNINIGNDAVTVRLGSNSSSSQVLIKPENLVGERSTQNVFNTVATQVNAFGAATTVTIGATTGTTNIRSNTTNLSNTNVSGNLTVGSNVSISGTLSVNSISTASVSNLFVSQVLRLNGNQITSGDIPSQFPVVRLANTSAANYLLNFGTEGQQLILINTQNAATSITVAQAGWNSGSSGAISMGTAGAAATLLFSGGRWHLIGSYRDFVGIS